MVGENTAGHHAASPPPTSTADDGKGVLDVSDAADHDDKHHTPTSSTPRWKKALQLLDWTPPSCRWDPDKPPVFSVAHNVLFAFAGSFTVSNLYYSYPILNILAEDFDVPYEMVARIPTLMQAGYATGLLFVCPLGDLLRRRPLVLGLIWFTATLWIGLCLTRSFTAFCIISYLCAVTTVVPQVMLPLVAELAPASKRAMALSIVTSGNLLGIVTARILSGIVTNYTSWRNIYWIALGLQYLVLTALFLWMPDYPSSNPAGLNYLKMIGGIMLLYGRHAVLVQAALISYCISAAYTCFWTTLTFLLADPPYHYSSEVIGLFGLIGIAGIVMGPFYARFIIQPFAPLFSCIVGLLATLTGVAVGTYTGTFTVAGPILQAFSLDMGFQITQVANRASIAAIEPNARNRVNTAFMLLTFTGQMTGTSAGANLYTRGGWRVSGSLSVGLLALTLLICVVRGPFEDGWFGWTGGWDIRKQNLAEAVAGPDVHVDLDVDVAEVDVERGPGTDREERQRKRSDEEK